MPKIKTPKLLVVFDTNVLFTQVASDLVRHDVKRIIQENSDHLDLTIGWYLPDVVIGERKYQMLTKAKELLPSMQKLEKLLGHTFGVGEDTLELHVDKAISNSIKDCGFQIATIDTNEIDWADLISRSIKRQPPFEENKKEKGFRDSIIAHSFLNLQNNSPSTPNICRLALISDDQRLREYVSELTVDSKNVRILSNLDELESLINTLVSTITEEFAAELAKKAELLFFEKGNTKTFYYKENIGEKIREQFSKELSDTIMPDNVRNGGTWWISNPLFIKKERQRIHWATTVEPEFEICHFEYDEQPPNQNLSLAEVFSSLSTIKSFGVGIPNATASTPTPSRGLRQGGLLGAAAYQKKIVDLKGKDKFEIHWSTTLSQAQNLTAPKLEGIQYMGNNLTEESS